METGNAIKKRFPIKNLIRYALLFAIIILPTALAVIYASYVGDGTVNSANINSVILSDVNGDPLFSEEKSRNSSHDSLIGIFNSIYENMTPASKEVPMDTMKPIVAEITAKSHKTTLTCYFSLTDGTGYAVEANGSTYSITHKDSLKFLSSPYAESLYENAIPPSLLTADGDTVLPASISWKYRNVDGELLTAERNRQTSTTDTYSVAESISLSFSTQPDKLTASVFNEGQQIFSGNLNQLSYLTLDNVSKVRVTCTATWDERADRDYSGRLTYDFVVTVHTLAAFSLDRSTLGIGEFALLKVDHVSNPSRISFFSENTEYVPLFHFVGDTAYAVIPYTALEDLTSISFTVSYGASKKDFTIEAELGATDFNNSITQYLTSNKINITIKSTVSSMPFFSAHGALPDGELFQRTTVFGDSASGASSAYYSEYASINGYGTSCTAITGGKVVYTGSNELLGSYAVIDVGLGLRVWYCRLSVVDVSVGEYVTSGEVIGKCGYLSKDTGNGFRLMLTYGDTVLCPESVIQRAFSDNQY